MMAILSLQRRTQGQPFFFEMARSLDYIRIQDLQLNSPLRIKALTGDFSIDSNSHSALCGENSQKNRQRTVIKTPTATCGIKGTSVALSQKGATLDVSLSTGLVELENEDEKIDLKPGKMIKGITKRGSFKEKVKDIPYRILIKPDRKKIDVPTAGNESEVSFTLQVIDVNSKLNVFKAARVLITVPSDKIVFSESIRLNSRGYRRVTAIIKPFQKADYGSGRIEVTALAEGERYMDIGTGQTVLTFDIPKKNPRVLRIDANSGAIK